MEYERLIKHTLANPVLSKTIQDMVNDCGILNLITPDWEVDLKEYPVHQRHMEKRVSFSKGHVCNEDKAFVRNIALPSDRYKVLLLGQWYYDVSKETHTSFVSCDCPPLTTIAETMRENPNQKLHDGARFFMDHCDPMLCITCSEAHKVNNVSIDSKRNWCVKKIRVFNGRDVKFTFKKILENTLKNLGQFYAICQVCIKSRTTFGDDKYKISGHIKDLIVFQESAIQPRMNLEFVEVSLTPHCIEFPSDNPPEEKVENILGN